MTLQQLKYFVCVAKHQSMSHAAKELFISQPTLSNSMKELETEMGITIFIRNNKGITLSSDGMGFLGYARQVLEQTSLLEEKYLGKKVKKVQFSVSTQHYSFAVNAFVDLLKDFEMDSYDVQLRETRTYEIIEDVKNLTSEVGVLYCNGFNRQIIHKLLKESDLEFYPLFLARPHVFLGKENPLAGCKKVTLHDLERYPYLSFEQGNYNAFYFSEEILSTLPREKTIKVSDRATLFNLLIGLNGYTISTGIISEELNGPNIVSVPLEVEEEIEVGYIRNKNAVLSKFGIYYIEKLKEYSVL